MTRISEHEFTDLYKAISEEAMMAFIAFAEDDGSCVFANRLARELLEVPTQVDITALRVDQLYPPPSEEGHIRLLTSEIIRLEGLFQDILIQKMNLHHFVANLGIRRVESGGRFYKLFMMQDMTIQNRLQRDIMAKQTEVKAAYEEVLNQNRKLKQLDAAKDKFIALTTHELRTPLAAMCGSAEVLKLELYDGEEQLKEFIDMIYEQGQHLMELVNDILDFAKVQAGRMDFFVEKRSLTKFVENQLESIESMALDNKVKIDFRYPAIDTTCYYDSLRLKQVMQNILSNAIKYNNEGGKVIVWFDQREDFIQIFVQDTGNGIAPEDISQVFNEFETLGKVAQHHKGTGLGMPITRKLIQGMGGDIFVRSKVGVGSTFYVELPTKKTLNENVYKRRPSDTEDLIAS